MLLTETCYYLENQGFGGVNTRDMSIIETCFCSRLYGIYFICTYKDFAYQCQSCYHQNNKSVDSFKVHIFWEDHQNLTKCPNHICNYLSALKKFWRFCHILWPSRNELYLSLKYISYVHTYVKKAFMKTFLLDWRYALDSKGRIKS